MKKVLSAAAVIVAIVAAYLIGAGNNSGTPAVINPTPTRSVAVQSKSDTVVIRPTTRLVTPKPTKTATGQMFSIPAPTPKAQTYIGNKNTKKFHYPTCSSVGQMKESNKVTLKSRQEAIDKGYVPCGRCHP